MRWFKWLYPGMRIKRWIFLFSVGILAVMFAAGFLWFGYVKYMYTHKANLLVFGTLLFVLGVILMIIGMRKMVKSFVTVFLPRREKDLLDIMFRQRALSKGPKIAVIGGGTGLAVLLHGLKEMTSNITAIVTVADDGGSSGRIRNEFDVLPPGDIRNCLIALSDAEVLMRDLFQYRFTEGEGLKGHSFGNLFITALSKITGDFEKAIKESSKVLAIRGSVVPSTLEKVTLTAKREDGTQTSGESTIPKVTGAVSRIKRLYLNPAGAKATPEALIALREADAIVIGPGSLYTSILPNLLVEGVVESILKSKGVKIYLCNVMTQRGETDGFAASDHVEALLRHTNSGLADYVFVNTAKIPQHFLDKYKIEGAYPVEADIKKIREMGLGVVEGDMITVDDFVRHNADKISKRIFELVYEVKGTSF
ncbi:MAG: YvcK family protein [Candidatus Omnitrophica bacterium]|nr:YvcK family protein [Candidatus Omnitrophota bacterium]MDD5311382.1 YvcK family protein [Candidatus Omnitrophota bacterium]MDD5546090.1 YvcK family protein [Candidatus Omnitrophota bacterium]